MKISYIILTIILLISYYLNNNNNKYFVKGGNINRYQKALADEYLNDKTDSVLNYFKTAEIISNGDYIFFNGVKLLIESSEIDYREELVNETINLLKSRNGINEIVKRFKGLLNTWSENDMFYENKNLKKVIYKYPKSIVYRKKNT